MSEIRVARSRLRPIGLGAVICATLLISLAHHALPSASADWYDALENLYYVPVVLGALLFGWRVGLSLGLLAVVSYLPAVLHAWPQRSSYLLERIVELTVLCAVGLLTGIFSDRDRKQRKDIERTTQELTEVYRKLQRNFEQMKRAERLFAVGQLAAGLAHELRNPLASLAGAAGILRRNANLEPKHQECVEIIDRESGRLNRLLTEFLDFARPRPARFQMVDVDRLLESVIQLATHGVGRETVEFHKDAPAALPRIEGDPELLKQMLLNLVINAVQAMPGGGKVAVCAALQDGKMRISVSDQGCGIAPEEKDRIFDPFFTTKETGTGLGLPVAHQIVEQHGGMLTAMANEERGTTFFALLPLYHKDTI